jgi:hypothetical protein
MIKIYGHPWSVYTRKVLMAVAEKGHQANFSLVMIPKGEHKQPAHVARHPFGKVPVLDDEGFVLYAASAINPYIDRRLEGPSLVPGRVVATSEFAADLAYRGPKRPAAIRGGDDGRRRRKDLSLRFASALTSEGIVAPRRLSR